MRQSSGRHWESAASRRQCAPDTCVNVPIGNAHLKLFIHGWMKVKAMTERFEWNGEACFDAEVAAACVSQCPPDAPQGRGRV